MEQTIEQWYSELQQYASAQGQAGLPPQDSLQSLYDMDYTPQEAFDKLWPPAKEVIENESTTTQAVPFDGDTAPSDVVALAESIATPSVSESDVLAKIVKKTFTLLPGGTTIVCEITMRNGQVEHGQSILTAGENSNTSAQAKALQNAVKAIWPHEVYLFREELYQQEQARIRAQTIAIEDQSDS